MKSPDRPAPVILVVDDERAILGLLTKALTRYGFDVRTTTHGGEAVALHRRGGIDIVLLDVQMPAPWDGPATLAAIRASEPTACAAFMSGGTGDYTEAQLHALGAARVFSKPFPRLADLAAALHELVAPRGG